MIKNIENNVLKNTVFQIIQNIQNVQIGLYNTNTVLVLFYANIFFTLITIRQSVPSSVLNHSLVVHKFVFFLFTAGKNDFVLFMSDNLVWVGDDNV